MDSRTVVKIGEDCRMGSELVGDFRMDLKRELQVLHRRDLEVPVGMELRTDSSAPERELQRERMDFQKGLAG